MIDNKPTFKHQGDVMFHPFIGNLPDKTLKHTGSFVLALGETTGHKHVITVERPDHMEMRQLENGEYVIVLSAAGTVTHEEHKMIVLEPGIYRVGKEREYDHFAHTVRSVID
jgi:hypothetical protein